MEPNYPTFQNSLVVSITSQFWIDVFDWEHMFVERTYIISFRYNMQRKFYARLISTRFTICDVFKDIYLQ